MAEYFDILDSKGNKTGETKLRTDVHRDGDWHRVVHIWIMNSKQELLMQRRSLDQESYPGMWDISVAGHISAGDSSLDAVAREMKEEIGLDVPKDRFEYLSTYSSRSVLNDGAYINNEFQDVYLVKLDLDISKIRLQAEEVSEVKWFSRDDLESILKDKKAEYVPHPEEYRFLLKLINKEV